MPYDTHSPVPTYLWAKNTSKAIVQFPPHSRASHFHAPASRASLTHPVARCERYLSI